MKKPVLSLLTASFLVLAVLALGSFAAEEDPAYWIDYMRQGGSAVRKKARAALYEMGPIAVPTLIDATRDEADFIRWEAVNALGTIANEHLEAVAPALPALVERVLTDRDSHVRWRTLVSVAVFPDEVVAERVLPLFREGLENDDATIAWNAVVGLAYFAQPDVVSLLNRGVLENEGFARFEAVSCLHMVHNEESVLVLAELITDTETTTESVRQEAAMTLRAIGDSRAVPALLSALEDPVAGVRARVAATLAKLAGVDALAAIEAALAKETDDYAIEQMQWAIEQLKGKAASTQ